MQRLLLAVWFWLIGCSSALAQPIVLGNTLPLSGPLEAAGKAARAGMDAYLARVAREGGVAGRSVVIRTLDDAYDPARHLDNVRQLLEQDKVDALVLSAGTSNIDKAYPLIEKSGRPLIGALTGASVLRSSDRPLIFHLRASYADEVRRLVLQAASVSQRRIFAVWQDDGLGRDAFAALQQALKGRDIQLVGEQGVVPTKIEGPALAAAIRASNADALFTLCITPCAAAVLSAIPSDGSYRFTPYALSIVNGETLAKAVGAASRGMVISQVLPNPHVATTALVRHYQQDMRQTGRSDFSYFSLEGYVSAMVAVQGLKAAHAGGGKRTMEEAMRSLTQREIEGIAISGGGHAGVRPHAVVLSMIGEGGRLVH